MSNQKRCGARLLAGLAGMLLALGAQAQSACGYGSGNPYGPAPFNAVVPLSVAVLSIGRDVPNGTVLYHQTIRNRGAYEVDCPASVATLRVFYNILATPKPLASWNSDPYPGRVFETGVPGIGVVLRTPGVVIPGTWTLENTDHTPWTWHLMLEPQILLLKIGPISPGLISGANLPSIKIDGGSNGVLLPLSTYRFTSSIRILSRTCKTPDQPVPLGEHSVKAFKGKGTGTPWKTFNIELQDCPAFYGAGRTVIYKENAAGSWVPNILEERANVLRYSLTPTTPTHPGSPGVVLPSPTASGPAAATGVGIEITNPAGTAVAFNTLMASGITPTRTEGASYRIPLRARYVQLGDTEPTPGPANASVMFTINYQ